MFGLLKKGRRFILRLVAEETFRPSRLLEEGKGLSVILGHMGISRDDLFTDTFPVNVCEHLGRAEKKGRRYIWR